MEGVLDKDQRLGEGRVEAEDGKLLHRKGADERDPPGADIRDVPEASGAQQEDLFLTEPLNGARLKWNRAWATPSGARGV